MELWMFITTAVVFTACGWYFRDEYLTIADTKRITQNTIDTLVEMGFVKTVGHGPDAEMVRWPEEDILFVEEEEDDDPRSS